MRAGAQPLLLNLLIFYQSDENPEKTLDSVGGDTLWTKIWEKLNYYVRENPGEMSAL
jgi:hypothetical protein